MSRIEPTSNGSPNADAQKQRITILENEVAALTAAARNQEKLVVEGYEKMEEMLRTVEAQRNEVSRTLDGLARTRGFLDRIIDTMDELLLVFGSDGKVARVNRRLEDLTGYGSDDLVGGSADHLFDPEAFEELRAQAHARFKGGTLSTVLSTARSKVLEADLVTKSGQRIPHLFRWANLYSSKGKKDGLVLVGTDIHDVKEAMGALEKAHAGMRRVLDNVNEGLLTVDPVGVLSKQASAIVFEWFGPIGEANAWDYLGRGDKAFKEAFELGFESFTDGFLPEVACLEQMPSRLNRGRAVYELRYRTLHDDDRFAGLLVIVTDITERLEADRIARQQIELVEIFQSIMKDRFGFGEFYEEACRTVSALVDAGSRQLSIDCGEPKATDQKAALHTLKGNCGLFGIASIAKLCHLIENRMEDEHRSATPVELEELAAAWHELSERLSMVLEGKGDVVEIAKAEFDEFMRKLLVNDQLDYLARIVGKWTFEPSRQRLQRVADQARSLAMRLGRDEIEVDIVSDNSRLPPERWAPFWASFAHVVRNAVDHGLEPPEERISAGKNPVGKLRLRTEAVRDEVIVEIADDGRGIDWPALRAKAERQGVGDVNALSDQELLFAEGLSTKDEASLVSGRGVGMGAIRQSCDRLGGSIEIETIRGQGTTVRFRIPKENNWSVDINAASASERIATSAAVGRRRPAL